MACGARQELWVGAYRLEGSLQSTSTFQVNQQMNAFPGAAHFFSFSWERGGKFTPKKRPSPWAEHNPAKKLCTKRYQILSGGETCVLDCMCGHVGAPLFPTLEPMPEAVVKQQETQSPLFLPRLSDKGPRRQTATLHAPTAVCGAFHKRLKYPFVHN